MKYTVTELKRLENPTDKAVTGASCNTEQTEGHPWRASTELNHGNTVSLRGKIRKGIERQRNRPAR